MFLANAHINELFAQEKIFSRLFFPNMYGINYPINNRQLQSSSILSNGLEYRFEKRIPWFIRFSIENIWVSYSINDYSITNTTKSKIRINGYQLGAGIRTKASKKLRFLFLVQAGILNYRYPMVDQLESSYCVNYFYRNCISYQAVIGMEYYFTKNFAVILESNYMVAPTRNSFWPNNFNDFAIKLGITTTLF